MKHQKAVADSERKRVRKIVLRFLLAIGLLIVVLAGYAFYWIFFDMNHFPTGEFLTEESSPNGAYTVKAFVTDGEPLRRMQFEVNWYRMKKQHAKNYLLELSGR